MKLATMAPWAVLFVLSAVLFYLTAEKMSEHDIAGHIRKQYEKKVGEKIKAEEAFAKRYGAVENNSLLYKLNRLITTSGIKKRLPFLNGQILLAAAAAAFLLGVILTAGLFHNVFVSAFAGAAAVVAVFAVLLFLSGRTYDAIEDSTETFVSILCNYARSSSDIVTIMENAGDSVDGPIRDLLKEFCLNCEKTGNIDYAFDVMKESVDNRQLQTILMNLKICMHYMANYEEVLAQMMSQIAESLSARAERKNILFSMKMTMVIISVASVVIVGIIGAGIGIDVIGTLTGNVVGQTLTFVTGLLYLFVLIKLFGTDRQ